MPVSRLIGCGNQVDSVDKATVSLSEAPAATLASAAPAAGAAKESASTPKAEAGTTAEAAPAAESGTAAGWGTLKGRVIFGGEPPKPKILVNKGDKSVTGGEICSAKEIDSERLVVDPKTKGLRYAIVYIPKPTAVNPEAAAAAKSAEVVFDQKNCTFIPHVIAAMRGATVTVKSTDAVPHNADAVGLLGNKFNETTQPNSSMPKVLKGLDARPGLVKCDIHGWMESYWLVLGNPYFAVTDAEGKFEMKNVPAGDQKVVVWAECLGPGNVTPTRRRVNRHQGGRGDDQGLHRGPVEGQGRIRSGVWLVASNPPKIRSILHLLGWDRP